MAAGLVCQKAEILFSCQCGDWNSLWLQYWCEACNQLQCGRCVSEEVSSLYCPHCLENVPSTEATTYHSRCKKCFECGRCGSNLQFVQRKSFGDVYFKCPFCSWTSLHSNVSAPTATELVAHYLADERASPAQRFVDEQAKRLQKDHHAFVAQTRIEGNPILQSKKIRDARSAVLLLGAAASSSSSSSSSDYIDDEAAPALALSMVGTPALRRETVLRALDEKRERVASELSFERASQRQAPLPPHFPLQRDDTAVVEQSLHLAAAQRRDDADSPPPRRIRLAVRKAKKCGACKGSLLVPDLGPSKSTFNQNCSAPLLLPRLFVDESASSAQPSELLVTLVVRPPKRPDDCPFTVSLLPASPDSPDASDLAVNAALSRPVERLVVPPHGPLTVPLRIAVSQPSAPVLRLLLNVHYSLDDKPFANLSAFLQLSFQTL